MGAIAADYDTVQAGVSYLYWYMPGMALQFPLVAWISRTPGFEVRHVFYLSVAAVALQALISYLLLRREFGSRLSFEPDPV